MLSACNTVHGFGQDIQRVGEKIQGKLSFPRNLVFHR
ncbi:entericidin A/B family lipoprotein [Collimonas sp.]